MTTDSTGGAAANEGGDADRLMSVLEQSRSLGFLGPGPLMFHVEHARTFRAAGDLEGAVLDLGCGGGVPGLVLAMECPPLRFTLLDAMERRCRFLQTAVEQLELSDRVEVLCGRAEELAHESGRRGGFGTVVARSFGSPAVTAECGVGFLEGEGSRLLVSEPPGSQGERWPVEGLAALHLRRGPLVAGPVASVQVLELLGPVPDRYPRRTGVPAKRPLF